MSFQLRTWFFTITGSVNKRGNRFKNGDRPDETAFKNLVDSTLFKSEADDRAKEDDPDADLRTLNGHVVASTSTQAKAFQDVKTDRTLVVQPHQLPSSKDQGSIDLTFTPVTYVQDYSGEIVDVSVDTGDANNSKRNNYLIAVTTAFRTWLRDSFQSLADGLTATSTTVDEHTAQIAAIQEILDTVTGGTIDLTQISPVGAIMAWSAPADPNAKWMVMDGRSLLRASYPALFSLIGTTYGQGSNPGTTFAIPNGKDRMLFGITSGSGVVSSLGGVGGASQKMLAALNIPPHVHNLTGPGATANAIINPSGAHTHTWTNGAPMKDTGNFNARQGSDASVSKDDTPTDIASSGAHTHGIGLTGATAPQYDPNLSQVAVDIMNPYLGVNWIIKVS